MLIYANKRENGTADIKNFFTKRCVTDIQALQKKGRQIFTRLNRRREKQNVGSSWTPLHSKTPIPSVTY